MLRHARKSMVQGVRLGLTLLLGSGMASSFAANEIIPGPGDVPDMFSIYPNYATSPLPVGICYPHGTVSKFKTDTSPPNGYLMAGGNGTDLDGTPQGCTSDATCLAFFPDLDESTKDPSGDTLNNTDNDPVCSQWVGGIRKFVDGLPGVGSPNNLGQVITLLKPDPKIGVPSDKEGSLPSGAEPFDYYEIAFVEYEEQMHSDLPPVKLRGYVQLATPTNPAGSNPGVTYSRGSRTFTYLTQPHYAPLIVAEMDKPVRIRFVNLLPPSPNDAIGIPVDLTYMGAGEGPVSQSGGRACDPNTRAATSASCATYPENRATVHLHGGTTPWISDGTPFQTLTPVDEPVGTQSGQTPAALATGSSKQDVPDMWYDASNNYDPIPECMGLPTCSVAGATTNPGQGTNSFYWTNQQSARLMFWHDHALGFTRLNVYKGMAGGYLLTDPRLDVELQDAGVPTLADKPENVIPLVIQEKGFVPSNAVDELGNYQPIGFNPGESANPGTPDNPLDYPAKFANLTGEFASQLHAQDPTWRDDGSWGGPGQLWWPHVYMPNQNPWDPTGVNPMGRWDYGPWMAIVGLPGIQKPDQPNPYFDPYCTPSALDNISCEPQFLPATPDAIALPGTSTPGLEPGKSWSPSGSPEVMLDTPVINGTLYPRLTVQPEVYRFHILSAANDRFLNLSWFVAARKDEPHTWLEEGKNRLCKGDAADPEKCTEVRMVPFNASQNAKSPFPLHWYTKVAKGITFDDRWGGVPDPTTRGPAWVQIGTEGGILPAPAVIKNQPINFFYDTKAPTRGNVNEKALFLGPAERADVVVDFTPFAGHCLILYSDSPSPVPAADPRNDYFTGATDTTDVGGAPPTLPGMGPNTRTLMQVCVEGSGGAGTPDHVNQDLLAQLKSTTLPGLPRLFFELQEPIIVPQVAYNAVADAALYPRVIADVPGVNLARDADTQLGPFTPWEGVPQTAIYNPTLPMNGNYQFKSLIEGFQPDYGRMNTNLGTQIAPTLITPGILGGSLQRFTDPPVDTMALTPYETTLNGAAPDGTQLWHLVHLGVDTHPIHFHMFHVQLVNRNPLGGGIALPDANELGWKDTVRMNPLEDVTVALRPRTLSLPFEIGNSWRLIDPTRPQGATGGMFSTLGPLGANPIPAPIVNDQVNFGWEFVWHCHILGHEEDDMMHAIPIASPPTAPDGLTASPSGSGTSRRMTLRWNDNSKNETSFLVQKATNINFNPVANTFIVTRPVPTATNPNTTGTVTFTDTIGRATAPIYYRVIARNTVGATSGWAVTDGYPTKSADSAPSNVAGLLPARPTAPTITVNPVTQTGGTQLTFTFNDRSNNEDRFLVQRCDNPTGAVASTCIWADVGSIAGSTNTGARSFVDNSVAIGSSYAYRVLAENSGGQSAWAEMTSTFKVVAQPPAAPTSATLARTGANVGGLTLTFMDNSSDETEFVIERSYISTDTGNWTTDPLIYFTVNPQSTPTGTRTYADTGVTAGLSYRYRVAAKNGDLISAYTGYTTAVIAPEALGIPQPVTVTCNRNSCSLKWTDNAYQETGYRVEKISPSPAVSATVGLNVTSYSFTGLARRTAYQFRVQAYAGSTNGTWSATVTGTTQ